MFVGIATHNLSAHGHGNRHRDTPLAWVVDEHLLYVHLLGPDTRAARL